MGVRGEGSEGSQGEGGVRGEGSEGQSASEGGGK